MTQMDLFQIATSSQQDTHANHSHLQGSAEAVKMTDISGRTYFPLFKKKDPLGAFSRMFMGMSLWASMKCYLTWKGKATPQGRLLFQLLPVTHPTEETEFGSSPEMWATPSAADSTGSTGGNQNKSLRTDVKMWPTRRACTAMSAENIQNRVNDKNPNLETVVARTIWPTPAARDYKGANGYERTKKKLENGERAQMGQLPNAVMMEEGKQISGSLNPQWVEWLMGYPEGWTDLED